MKLSKLFMKLAKEMENNHFFGIPGRWSAFRLNGQW